MKRTYVVALAVLGVSVGLAGCVEGSFSAGSGGASFDLFVSDQPNQIESFDSLTVSFDKARLFSPEYNKTGYREIQLNGKSVDLTTVTGDKADKIASVNLKAGQYTKVELHTQSADGVVNGSQVNVKVPSQMLMITKSFTVEANTTTQFVFDIKVVKQGTGHPVNSTYNLLPVISQSGVNVPIERTKPLN